MKAPTITIPAPGNVALASVLAPNFKGVVDAKTLAKYVLNALITIKRNNLPVKVYMSRELANKIGNLLIALGIKFRTIPLSKIEKPCILLDTENGDVVVRIVDESGRESLYRVPFTKFVEEFEQLATSVLRKRQQKEKTRKDEFVEELILDSMDEKQFLAMLSELMGEGR